MVKTVSLTANQETEVELMGGCHCCIENRGNGVIYASKSADIVPDSDGVTAIDSGNSKVLRNIAQYKKDDNSSYDYYGKIYLLSDLDGKAEIQTANDLNFFSRKNLAKGGGTYDDTAIKSDISNLQTGKANKSDVYTKTETDNKITEKVAEIVADAPEDFDTLKEMSDWIANHENDASAMNSDIQTNASAITALQSGKVDIVSGKGLSTNDFTTTYKNKLDSLENYDDTAVKSNIAMNLSGIGMTKKNLLKNTAVTTERAGVTYTVREDGSVMLTGANIATSYNFFSIPVTLQPGRYKVNGMPENSSDRTYRVDLRANESGGTVYGYGMSEFEVEFTETTSVYYMIRIDASYKDNLNGVTFYPMIRYADITDGTYEPYKDDLQTQINAIITRLTALEGGA